MPRCPGQGDRRDEKVRGDQQGAHDQERRGACALLHDKLMAGVSVMGPPGPGATLSGVTGRGQRKRRSKRKTNDNEGLLRFVYLRM
jgi:hypothetical protein